MESNMVSNIYDFKNSEEGLHFLRENIENLFPNFILKASNVNITYNAFQVSYICDNIIINIGCERNSLTHLIEIDNHQFTLYQFDDQMKDVLAFSRGNILFTLSLLKKVLSR